MNFPLHPDTPADGIALEDLFGGPQAKERIEASSRRLRQIAASEGLPMADRTKTYNSRLAQELGVWAAEQGKGEAYQDAVFRAYFAEARDISDMDVLLDLAGRIGLDAKGAKRVLEERTYREAVDREWERCRARGVNAVPTFEAGGRQVVGAQPYDVLERLVQAAGAKPRAR